MTVVVGVAAPDGIVLAADSRTTTFPDGAGPQARHRILTDTAEKIFTICDRHAVATYGDAFIGSKTIAGLMDEFRAQIEPALPDDTRAFAEALGDFFHGRYQDAFDEAGEELAPDEPARLGFLIAGYGADGIGQVHEVLTPGPTLNDELTLTTASIGVSWRGQTDTINRLIAGVDWTALAETGKEIPDDVVETLNGLEYDLIYPVSLQDAIDFAGFLIRSTIDMQRFSDGLRSAPGGLPGCGGETRVVVVQRGRVEWVSQGALTANGRIGWAEGSIV